MQQKERSYYRSLYEVAVAVNSSHTPEGVLWRTCRSVAKALEAKGCSLMLLTPDKKSLLHTAAYGLSDWFVEKGPVSADRSISEALKGKAVAVLDATKDERIQYREHVKREGIASVLSVPMMLREEIIGVVRIYTDEARHFTEDDIFFANAAANLGAIALENAWLHESVEKDYEALRRDMLEWRAALGHEWMAGETVAPP